jgi:glycosyltransferase involved in cell wall biosynthesis
LESKRRIVIINQASNYLTVGFANAFSEKFDKVALVSGSIHIQGEELNPEVEVVKINKWAERPPSKKFLSYIIAVGKIFWLLVTRFRKYEVLFISLPPMGYLLNLLLPHKFSMLIWDVYPDVFKITGMTEKHPVYRTWAYLNKRSFRKAFRIFTIGNKIAQLLEKYTDPSKIVISPIWSIFQDNEKISREKNIFIREHRLEDKFIVQYSGNIGLTHNAEIMIDLAERLKENNGILFQIIGRGPRKEHLEKMVSEKKLENCMFLPFQSDEMFPHSLSATDIGIVVLNKLTSKGSVPSKSYNLMNLGIPSLYIASRDSELYDYAEKFKHAECYQEDEIDKAVEYIINLSKNKDLMKSYSDNALKAAERFKRENADQLVSLYLSSTVSTIHENNPIA